MEKTMSTTTEQLWNIIIDIVDCNAKDEIWACVPGATHQEVTATKTRMLELLEAAKYKTREKEPL